MNPEEAIKAIRAQGGTDADVEAYLRSIGAQEVTGPTEEERKVRARERQAQNAAEKKLAGWDRLGANAQMFADAATFGLAGLADDALSPGGFAANRQARRMAREGTSGTEQVLSSVAGALANPAGAIIRAPATAGLLGRVVARGADAALQGGVQAGVEGIEGASASDLGRAAGRAGTAALVAPLASGVTGGLLGAARNANVMRRVFSAKPIDEVAFEMRDAMARADNALYGAVAQEAGAVGTTRAIRDVLESQTVKPFADMVRRSETFQNANDATVLTEAYKLMSRAQRRAARQVEGTPEFLADVELKRSDIGLAKGRMMDAASQPSGNFPPPLPSFQSAVDTHRIAAGENEAFLQTADAVRRVLEGTSVRGKKLTLESREALRRTIAQMTPAEAERALEATLGRGREVARLTANPVGKFGLVSTVARSLHAPFQINEFVQLLEKQAGRQPRLFDNPAVAERGRTATARITGGLLSR